MVYFWGKIVYYKDAGISSHLIISISKDNKKLKFLNPKRLIPNLLSTSGLGRLD